ncbi:MAG: DUF167 domain-containing protein [Candidatus Aminicenantes bacterium]|nr:DUF167 domain-containing protein [Candidatus Aminicenantes bacterium]
MKIRVKVHPRAKKEKVIEGEDLWEIWVNEPPEGGKANKRVIELLAKKLGISKSRIEIITGHKSRQKILEVKDA